MKDVRITCVFNFGSFAFFFFFVVLVLLVTLCRVFLTGFLRRNYNKEI